MLEIRNFLNWPNNMKFSRSFFKGPFQVSRSSLEDLIQRTAVYVAQHKMIPTQPCKPEYFVKMFTTIALAFIMMPMCVAIIRFNIGDYYFIIGLSM